MLQLLFVTMLMVMLVLMLVLMVMLMLVLLSGEASPQRWLHCAAGYFAAALRDPSRKKRRAPEVVKRHRNV